MALAGHLVSSDKPPGVRMSFAALAILIPLMLALGAAMASVRRSDLSTINASIATVTLAQAQEAERTIQAANAIRSIQAADLLRLENRMLRIEDKLDRMLWDKR